LHFFHHAPLSPSLLFDQLLPSDALNAEERAILLATQHQLFILGLPLFGLFLHPSHPLH